MRSGTPQVAQQRLELFDAVDGERGVADVAQVLMDVALHVGQLAGSLDHAACRVPQLGDLALDPDHGQRITAQGYPPGGQQSRRHASRRWRRRHAGPGMDEAAPIEL